MNILILILMPVALLAPTANAMSTDLGAILPAVTRTNIQGVLQTADRFAQLEASQPLGPEGMEEYWQQADRFDKALDLVAASVDEAHVAAAAGEETIEAKLLVIAWDRRLHKDRYDEIESEYVSIKAYRERFGSSSDREQSLGIHRVEARHRSESYRLVWEYLLLRPLRQETRSRLLIEALWTIRSIKDERSLVALRHKFALNRYNRRFLNTQQVGEQSMLLGAISDFPSEAGLTTLLDCMGMTEEQPRKPLDYDKSWDVDQAVRQSLTDSNPTPQGLVRRRQWSDVVAEYTTEGRNLSERQHRFLRDLQSSLAENAPEP